MIIGKQIRKQYGSLEVLKGVDLHIKESEVVSIVGSSGAGKTTLLTILGTLDRPSSGEILFSGTNITSLNEKKLAAFRNQHIGFVFQFHHLLPEFNAYENVIIPAMIAQKKEAEYKKKAEGLLDYLGLSNRLTHKPNELSGGEQQRVAIARALINDPSIIMADEPTGNLDSSTSAEIHQLISNLRQELNITFVIVTHNNELAELSDRSLRMLDGLII